MKGSRQDPSKGTTSSDSIVGHSSAVRRERRGSD